MVLETLSSTIPEDLYNLTQLAEVTLAAGRLSTTNINEITEYIKKEKNKQISSCDADHFRANNSDFLDGPDGCGVDSEENQQRRTMPESWNDHATENSDPIDDLHVHRDSHSVIRRNHTVGNIFDFDRESHIRCDSDQMNFLSSSDDDSNYYSHKIFDRKKSRRSTFSDNPRQNELSCSSLPSSGDEHFSGRFTKNNSQNDSSADDDHVCPECGKKYSTSSNLARHRQTHRSILDKKARRCPHCDKVYVSMPAYSMHVRTHNQGCECPHCGKCFSRPWLLQGHIRTHTGEKPFKCNICSKAFADKSNLRAHVQTHSNTKPHSCTRCGKAFALKSYLYKHEESSCMRNHLKQDKDRSSKHQSKNDIPINQSSQQTTKNSSKEFLGSTLLESFSTSSVSMPPKQPSTDSRIILEENSEKSYTTLTSPMSAEEYERFSRISVIRTPVTNLPIHHHHLHHQGSYDPCTINGGTSPLELNFYQEAPVDFSPKNNFSHSSKTSPFELTGSYAIVA